VPAAAGLAVVLSGVGCRSQAAPNLPPRSSLSPESRASRCDDALGRAPLGAGAVKALLDRLTFKKENDREQLASTVALSAPVSKVPGDEQPGAEAIAGEVKRQELPDGRCAAWLQTEYTEGPMPTTSGVLVVLAPERAAVRVEAATRYSADEGSLGFGRSRSYGAVTLYVADGDIDGGGGPEGGRSECIWSVSKNRIDDALCYSVHHDDPPSVGAGWSIASETAATLAPNGVVLRTHVELKWSPPSEEQKGCRPGWLTAPDDRWLEPHQIAYDYDEPYALDGMILTPIRPHADPLHRETYVPDWVDAKAVELKLPPVLSGSGDLDCSADPAE
jgi:hypothetical protein